MKKLICAIIAFLMMAALAGCRENNSAKPQDQSVNSISAVMQQQMDQINSELKNETQQQTDQSIANLKNDAQQKIDQGNAKQKTDTQQSNESEENSVQKTADDSSDIDVDLTELSSTMVYSEVYNMMTAPEEYIGKTVRMRGQFALYQATDENGQPVPDQIYFACVIADATACCQQGLEFVLAGDYKYPDDYPELGTDITVVGEFQTYMEGEYQYCHLVNSRFD